MSLNPGKCKVLTLSLRRDRVTLGYDVGGVTLERVCAMHDLGVILDEKLTFADHIDCVARKANRAFGLLMRSFQTGKHGKTLYSCNFRAVISACRANVRSVLEYGSVIWSGTADTHLSRLESIQHKFMIWLCCRCRFTDVPLRYEALERRFSLAPKPWTKATPLSMPKRRQQHDLMFVRNVRRHCINSAFLPGHLRLAVQSETRADKPYVTYPVELTRWSGDYSFESQNYATGF